MLGAKVFVDLEKTSETWLMTSTARLYSTASGFERWASPAEEDENAVSAPRRSAVMLSSINRRTGVFLGWAARGATLGGLLVVAVPYSAGKGSGGRFASLSAISEAASPSAEGFHPIKFDEGVSLLLPSRMAGSIYDRT